MNILKRAITSQISLSSHPSRKWRFLLYSTTYTLNPPKPRKRSQAPVRPPPAASSSISQGVTDEADKLAHWPRPSEIPYQSKVANLVNLIGHIRAPIKFQTSPDGKYWAGTVIYEDNGLDRSCLIPILFEGDLAHVVACHMKENDCVYVMGRLSDDPTPLVLGDTLGKFHLRVENINFVQGFEKRSFEQRSRKASDANLFLASSETLMKEENAEALGKLGARDSDVSADGEISQTSLKSADTKKGEDSDLESWRGLVENPRLWRDYREMKTKGLLANKFPDFKHKDTNAGLWLRSAPVWVLETLPSLDFDLPPPKQEVSMFSANRKNSQTGPQGDDTKKGEASVRDPWRDLVQNSRQWKDYREHKSKGLVGNKFPDFKHKDTGAPLWLNKAPEWVLGGLQNLDFDFPPPKQKQVKDPKEDLWKSLAENPDQWWDNRFEKRNPKAPDFKHKQSGEVLWLNNLPDWVMSKLPPTREK